MLQALVDTIAQPSRTVWWRADLASGADHDLAAELADRLGEHHDLAVLEDALRGDHGAYGVPHDVDAVLVLARRHRVLLEEQCLRLTRHLVAGGAESLTERLGSEWAAWRS